MGAIALFADRDPKPRAHGALLQAREGGWFNVATVETRLRRLVGDHRALELGDAVPQPQFALLEALDGQFVGLDVGDEVLDRGVEVAVFEPELGQLPGGDDGIGAFAHVPSLARAVVSRQRGGGR